MKIQYFHVPINSQLCNVVTNNLNLKSPTCPWYTCVWWQCCVMHLHRLHFIFLNHLFFSELWKSFLNFSYFYGPIFCILYQTLLPKGRSFQPYMPGPIQLMFWRKNPSTQKDLIFTALFISMIIKTRQLMFLLHLKGQLNHCHESFNLTTWTILLTGELVVNFHNDMTQL